MSVIWSFFKTFNRYQRYQKTHKIIFLFFIVFFLNSILSSISYAVPKTFNFQARIKKPNGQSLESSAVNFRFTYTDESGNCVLYIEDFAGVVLASGGGGLVNIALGTGIRAYPSAGGTVLYDVFNNSGSSLNCQSGATFTPVSTDRRSLVMQFSYSGSSGWQTLAPVKINSVPYAMYSSESLNAQNASKLGGVAASSYPKLTDFATCAITEVLTFNGANFTCIIPAGGGTVTNVTASAPLSSSGGATPNITISQANTTTSGYLSNTDWNTFNNKQSALGFTPLNPANNLSDVANAVTSRTNLGLGTAAVLNAPASGDASAAELVKGNDSRLTGAFQSASSLSGDVTGTVSTTVVSSVGGKTAANIAISVNDTQAATNSNTASTIIRRDASGDFTAGTINATTFSGTNVSTTNTSTQNVYLYDATSVNRILFKAPSSGITNYTLTLPPAMGSNGQVLAINASGDLSWANAASGSVTSVTANAPLSSTGGSTPAISITQADGATNGYLSSTDWTTFNNKLGTSLTSANIFVGNGSNVATGVAMSGDAMLDNTGVLTLANTIGSSGTSSKVTYDAKGRITATAAQTSADITTALGYTPVNKAGDTMTGALSMGGYALYGNNTASGNLILDSTSNATKGNIILATQGGNIGIGTSSPTEKLEIYNGDSTVTGDNTWAALWARQYSATKYAEIVASRKRGSYAVPAEVQSGDILGSLSFRNSSSNEGADVRGIATENHSASAYGAALSFYTIGNTTIIPTEKMRIDQNGYVGIGTTTPATELDVNGTVTVKASVELAQANTSISTNTTMAAPSGGNIYRYTLTGNVILTLPTPPTTTNGVLQVTVMIYQDATGSRTLSFIPPSGLIAWSGGTEPTLCTTASQRTMYQFIKLEGDTAWYGAQTWKECP